MTSPVDVRLDTALGTPSGYIVPSGVRSFKASLKGPRAVTAFHKWREEFYTRQLYLALQDMILHHPKEVQSESALVQLGVTQGLVLAAQLISDPSVLWPDVYGEGLESPSMQSIQEPPEEDYGTSIDDSIDK